MCTLTQNISFILIWFEKLSLTILVPPFSCSKTFLQCVVIFHYIIYVSQIYTVDYRMLIIHVGGLISVTSHFIISLYEWCNPHHESLPVSVTHSLLLCFLCMLRAVLFLFISFLFQFSGRLILVKMKIRSHLIESTQLLFPLDWMSQHVSSYRTESNETEENSRGKTFSHSYTNAIVSG